MSLRGGGREAVEDTPVTGATDSESQSNLSQDAIEALAMTIPGLWAEAMQEAVLMSRAMSESGFVIVRAEDALTAEDRAAIAGICAHSETMLRFLYQDGGYTLGECDELNQSFNRLRAIAAGGQE